MQWMLVLAACGGSDPAVPDAAPSIDARIDAAAIDAPSIDASDVDFSCLGQPPPAGATAVAGKVFAIVQYQVVPEAGAQVELRRLDDSLAGEATTGSDGAFTIAVAAPVSGSLVVTAAGKLPTRAVSDVPFGGDDALVVVADAAELARWYADAGTTAASGARTLLTVARDCQGKTLAGSTLTTAPAATVTYYDDQAQHWDPALAATTNGFTLIANAPASIAVTAHAGVALPAETYAPAAGALTLAVISPYD